MSLPCDTFSPGPWSFALEEGDYWSITDEAGVEIVLLQSPTSYNARLIAAAPALLATLKQVLYECEKNCAADAAFYARKAIAEAEGTS